MPMHRKIVRAQINSLAEDEVEVVMSTAALARDGHVLVPQGCLLDEYRANPIILWSHDPDQPVGNAENIAVAGDKITARIRFAPAGASAKADEVRRLVKGGVVRAVSVGFDPIEMKPLDPKKPYGGQRITAWTLLECSFVSVPADVGAVVTARSKRTGKVLNAANVEALKNAHAAAGTVQQHIEGVLSSAGIEPDAEDAIEGDRARHEHWRRQVEVMELRWAPGELEELEARDDERRAPTDYAARQRHLARITKALTK